MPKYEIMLITDPKVDVEVTKKLTKEVFGEDVESVEKLDRTKLSYKINNSTVGTYLVLNVDTKTSNIKEFMRKINLQKSIWRHLIVNLDAEKGKRIKSQIAAKKASERKPIERRFFRAPRNIETIELATNKVDNKGANNNE